MRADLIIEGLNRGAKFLPGDLHQAEFRDPADIHLGLIPFHGDLDLPLHLTDILLTPHIDEIDHDQPTQITQPQLTGKLCCRLHVGLKDRILKILTFAGGSRIHINSHQGLSGINDN